MSLFGTWIIFSLSVYLVAQFYPAVKVRGFGTALFAAAIYGLLKFLLYNLLIFLSLPLIAVTLGLFLFVVNAILLYLTDKMVSGLTIKSFGHTIVASVFITLIDMSLRWVLTAVF